MTLEGHKGEERPLYADQPPAVGRFDGSFNANQHRWFCCHFFGNKTPQIANFCCHFLPKWQQNGVDFRQLLSTSLNQQRSK